MTEKKRPMRARIREVFAARKQAKREEHRTASTQMLAALQNARHVYAGTVPDHVKARRRARNKVARASRRANRRTR